MISAEAWAHLNIGNIKSDGYNYKTVMTEMKGKGVVPVHHIFPALGLLKKYIDSILERYKDEENPPRDVAILQKALQGSKSRGLNKSSGGFTKLIENIQKIKMKARFVDLGEEVEKLNLEDKMKSMSKSVKTPRENGEDNLDLVESEESEEVEEEGEVLWDDVGSSAQADVLARVQARAVLAPTQVPPSGQRQELPGAQNPNGLPGPVQHPPDRVQPGLLHGHPDLSLSAHQRHL